VARSNRGTRGPRQKVEDKVRRAEALVLFRDGLTYDQVAAKMREKGYQCAGKSTARDLVYGALEDLWVEPAEDVRQYELARLEMSYVRHEQTIERLDGVIEKLLPLAESGNLEVIDRLVKAETARAKANDSHIRICESRRKLLGIDAPEKVDLTGAVGIGPSIFIPAERPDHLLESGGLAPEPGASN
jgi:hypothetical protein